MTLEDYQELLLQQLDCFGERDYAIQFHDDLSPAGWHLGHCVYTETYWIREQLLMTQAVENPLKELFVPERSLKKERGNKIASFRELRDWSERMQAENRRLIAEYNGQAADHELIQDDFMFQFLKQHYAQHFETLQMVRAQRMLREDQEYRPGNPLESRRQTDTFIYLNGADVRIGSGVSWHYDNEKPVFTCQPGPLEISRLPVNNAAYLYFM
ncbi:MAG: DinB family protein, partial [Gammaproteobacteria bacterium]|nr:DinB family protein [Gammaproteobacteria bacterium]